MIGIIYKFTIRAKIKYKDHKPYYIGQHWHNGSLEEFESMYNDYWGSGTIWNALLNKLREKNTKNWRVFVKREILFSSDSVSQKALDKLEEFYIKKYKSCYFSNLGGCNIIQGSANEIGINNPAKDPMVRKYLSDLWKTEEFRDKQKITRLKNKEKNSEKIREIWKRPGYREKMSNIRKQVFENDEFREEHSKRVKEALSRKDVKIKLSKSQKESWEKEERIENARKVMIEKWKDPEFRAMMIERNGQRGKPLCNKARLALSKANQGRKFTEEHRRKLSLAKKGKYVGEKSPFYGRKASPETLKKLSESHKGGYWVNNGKENLYRRPNETIPEGYVRGKLKIK